MKEENPSCVTFVDFLRDLKKVYGMAHKKEVVKNYRDIVKKLEDSVMTPKLHIIFEHSPKYFELTGKTLRKKTDQTVEATHAKLGKFIRSHNSQKAKCKMESVFFFLKSLYSIFTFLKVFLTLFVFLHVIYFLLRC